MLKILKFLKKGSRPIKNFLSGDNKAGEIVHGVLDLLPIPNQAIAKLFKVLLSGDEKEIRQEAGKILTVRNITAILMAVLIVSGMVTLKQITEFVNILTKLLTLFG